MTATIRWAVKESLHEYLGTLEDATIEVTGDIERDGVHFVLRANDANFDWDSLTGTVQFTGSIVFSAYAGAMRIELTNPKLQLTGDTGVLWVQQGGFFGSPTHITLADLTRAATQSGASGTVFDASLTFTGRSVLGEQYQVGQALSPITLTRS